jgi:integrase
MKGHIRERSPGKWAIVIDTHDPETGKRKPRWHSFRGTKREAQIECARLISAMNGGTYLEPSKTTLAQFLEVWLTHKRMGVSPKTYERYEQVCRKNLAPLLGAVKLPKLTPDQVSTALSRAGDGGLAPRTVHHMHVILKSALKQAVIWDKLVKNPAAAVKAPRVERKRMSTYDVGQTAECLELVRETRMHVPVVLAVQCGMRLGEIAAIKWRNVDLGAGQLAVVESAEQTKAGVRYKPPKSGRTRTLALPMSVVEALRAHRLRQAEELLKLGVRPTDDTFVITQADSSPLQPHSLGQEWVRFLARHPALPRIRFHDLRHAHATHMLASNVHPKIVSERMGHSKVGITMDLYSHVLPNMQDDAVAIVDDALQAALQKHRSQPKG